MTNMSLMMPSAALTAVGILTILLELKAAAGRDKIKPESSEKLLGVSIGNMARYRTRYTYNGVEYETDILVHEQLFTAKPEYILVKRSNPEDAISYNNGVIAAISALWLLLMGAAGILISLLIM